ncbi:MAG: PilW family protein [Pseudomonadota bacterium]
MEPRSSHKQLRGFTLVEMIVTIVLLGIISAALAPFFFSAVSGYFDTQARARLTGEGRLALERLSRELREADPASISVNGGGSRISFTLLRDLDSVTQVGNMVVKTYEACRDIRVERTGNNLVWDEGDDGNPDGILATHLDSIQFSYLAGTTHRSGIVTMSMTLEREGESIDLYREAHLRNAQGSVICP